MFWRFSKLSPAKSPFSICGREALTSKVTNLMLRKGDIIRLETSGGGGFGDPTMRIGEQVERDVRLGYVSPDGAASSYGRRRAGTV